MPHFNERRHKAYLVRESPVKLVMTSCRSPSAPLLSPDSGKIMRVPKHVPRHCYLQLEVGSFELSVTCLVTGRRGAVASATRAALRRSRSRASADLGLSPMSKVDHLVPWYGPLIYGHFWRPCEVSELYQRLWGAGLKSMRGWSQNRRAAL